ncbi:MAG: trypsin-like peptidase domain-containing protein [Solobacterium sp.]|nr:trypsin-like peptidase domain-containing protein [Solobacterium sp.]
MRRRVLIITAGNADRSFVEQAFRQNGFRIITGQGTDSVLTADAVVFVCAEGCEEEEAFLQALMLARSRSVPSVILYGQYLPDEYYSGWKEGTYFDASELSFSKLRETLDEQDPFVRQPLSAKEKKNWNRFYVLLTILMFVFAGFLLAQLTPHADPVTPPAAQEEVLLNEYGDSVVQVYTIGAFEEKIYRGSGFVIREDGYILTNAHVIDHPSSRYMILYQGRKINAEVVRYSSEKDIALLKVNEHLRDAMHFADSEPEKNASIFVIGFPEHNGKTAVTGIFEGTRIEAESGITYTAAVLSLKPGNSGSPVCNENGEVIGIATAVSTVQEGIAFLVPFDVCREFLKDILFV